MAFRYVDDLKPKQQSGRKKLIGPDELVELRANVGRWAVVREYTNHSAAATAVRGIRGYAPADVEAEYRGCTLYVRSVGVGVKGARP